MEKAKKAVADALRACADFSEVVELWNMCAEENHYSEVVYNFDLDLLNDWFSTPAAAVLAVRNGNLFLSDDFIYLDDSGSVQSFSSADASNCPVDFGVLAAFLLERFNADELADKIGVAVESLQVVESVG